MYDNEMIKIPIHSQMGKRTKRILCIGASICAAMILLSATGGVNRVKEWILPGNAQVTEAALDNLVTDLKEGEKLEDAITAFCQEIIDHAKIPQ
jgi:hypothetical protein